MQIIPQIETLLQSVTGGVARFISSVTDSNSRERLTVQTLEHEYPTFTYLANDITVTAGTTMFSLFNAVGSTVRLRVHEIRVQNSGLQLGGNEIATIDFERFTTIHTGGTLLTAVAYDTEDTLDSNVTARSLGTTSAGALLRRTSVSADEWTAGALDAENFYAAFSAFHPNYYKLAPSMKNITLRPGQGLRIHPSAKSGGGTDGSFHIVITFTQEPNA